MFFADTAKVLQWESANYAAAAVPSRKAFHFFHRYPVEVSLKGLLEAGGCHSKFYSFLRLIIVVQGIDKTTPERISSTDPIPKPHIIGVRKEALAIAVKQACPPIVTG